MRHPVVARIVNACEAGRGRNKTQSGVGAERKREARDRTEMSRVIPDLQLACENHAGLPDEAFSFNAGWTALFRKVSGRGGSHPFADEAESHDLT